MGIEHGVGQLTAAVRTLACSDRPLAERLQLAWDEHVQLLWTSVYLPDELNERFKAMWARFTAASDDPRSTRLRLMSADELAEAAAELVALAVDAVAAHARGESAAPVPDR